MTKEALLCFEIATLISLARNDGGGVLLAWMDKIAASVKHHDNKH